MASEKQIVLFKELTERKTFPEGTNVENLRNEFASLPQAEASRWIERAMELPNGEDSGKPVPF